MAEFRYLGMTLASEFHSPRDYEQILEIRFIQKLPTYRLLHKRVNSKTQRSLILPAVLYGCGTGSLVLRFERTVNMCDNRLMKEISGTERGVSDKSLDKITS
jgi:hypothetical protein